MKAKEPGYEYQVQGLYCGRWETVTTEETKEDAIAMKQCYDENELGILHRYVRTRVKEG